MSAKAPRTRQERKSFTSAIAINYGGGNQTLTTAARGVYIGTAGNLVVDLVDNPGVQVTFSGLLVGNIYWIAVGTTVYQTGSSAAGLLLF